MADYHWNVQYAAEEFSTLSEAVEWINITSDGKHHCYPAIKKVEGGYLATVKYAIKNHNVDTLDKNILY